jgi:hypothetical protein
LALTDAKNLAAKRFALHHQVSATELVNYTDAQAAGSFLQQMKIEDLLAGKEKTFVLEKLDLHSHHPTDSEWNPHAMDRAREAPSSYEQRVVRSAPATVGKYHPILLAAEALSKHPAPTTWTS